jgi:hypothetical protein
MQNPSLDAHIWPNITSLKTQEKQDSQAPAVLLSNCFIGLAYQSKDIVFRFITEYSSLRDFDC